MGFTTVTNKSTLELLFFYFIIFIPNALASDFIKEYSEKSFARFCAFLRLLKVIKSGAKFLRFISL